MAKTTKKPVATKPKAETNMLDWDLAEQKLNAAVAKREEDGHYYNTVVAPLVETFNAGGLNSALYLAMMAL